MVSYREAVSRVQDFFTFSRGELSGLALATVVTAFIFTFRDWGRETFSLTMGLQNVVILLVIGGLSFFFRVSCQKIYALLQGYKVEFRSWGAGLLIALVIAFLSRGRIPLILVGGITASFMVRQRLGEFRYAYSYWQNGIMSLWAVYASLIMAILFGIGYYLVPQSYFFQKGVFVNLIMGFCALLPLPQMEGINIFFAARWLWVVALGMMLLATVLLLTRTLPGLLFLIIAGVVLGGVYLLIGSEK